MKRRILRWGGMLIFWFSLGIAGAKESNTIQWYHADFPPISIVSGPDAGTGYADLMEKYLSERLPEFQHEFQVANYQRIARELSEPTHACSAAIFKTTEREKVMLFSEPFFVSLPNGVIIRQSEFEKFQPYLTASREFQLQQALKNKELYMGVSAGRAYTGVIDQLIQEFKGQSNLMLRASDDVFRGLFEMLLRERLDYIIGFPTEMQYFAKQMKVEGQVLFFPVEGMRSFSVARGACSQTPWGQQVIDRLNQVAKNAWQTTFAGYYLQWLDPVSQERYQRILKEAATQPLPQH